MCVMRSLTDIGHVYDYRLREVAAVGVGGCHGDVVVHPDRRVVLVEVT